MPPPGSVEIDAPKVQGESVPRRSYCSPDHLVTSPAPGISTVPDILKYAMRTHGGKNAYGWRDVVKVIEEQKEVKKTIGGKEVTETKTWKYFQLSDYKYISYQDFGENVKKLAVTLIDKGINVGDVFNIYASTGLNWQYMQFACALINTSIATAYETLGEEGLSHSLSEPECVGVFTHPELLGSVAKVLKDTPTIRFIFYDGEPAQKILDDIRAQRPDITLAHIDDLIKQGNDLLPQMNAQLEARAPKPDDVSCIMYTSGSTGAPKGVVLRHSNLVASVGAVFTLLGHHLQPTDAILAYLPLAHILEYIVEMTFFFAGVVLGFGKVKTLTDASVRNCRGDIATFAPTILVGVPAVWETIRKGIVGKVAAAGSITQSVFNGALTIKKNIPLAGSVIDNTILKSVKAATGGRLRLALSGGAALSRETQEFLDLALVTLLQGYGMTESCGMCAILPPEYMQYSNVGVPVPSIEIKLLDAPEAGYITSETPQRGEILIRGPSVTKGYFKRDDLNNDPNIFTPDGWLRTGDIGQWNKDGTLSIIDRIKNLVKLSGGEYIALERLESTYKSCNVVANICVHAHTDAKQPMGIILPHEHNLRAALKSDPATASLADQDMHAICEDKKAAALVLKAINDVGKKNGFKGMELLEAVVLTPEEWTPESGLVTAAQKINRKAIATKYKDEIKAVYPY
ncbi:long-chain fatty acid-CoA ligase [Tulasnella sp. 424]|nr:long-chain fatty acid-CoA ligase [Tulasnella sp. 424]KAG8976338.1 long-chain fatty acid-CoA ligase [Tulasnella sp. 425]